jgi:hypothetical protein
MENQDIDEMLKRWDCEPSLSECFATLRDVLYYLLKGEQDYMDFLFENDLEEKYDEWQQSRNPDPEPPAGLHIVK